MCGIAGFFLDNPLPFTLALAMAQRCLSTLYDRGPDGQGWVFFTNQGTVSSFNEAIDPNTLVFGALLHTRLKIIDLSDRAAQPMSASSGRFWLTYNGEVYNFLEIRTELESHGWDFYSDSDTEVVLKAYLQWGNNALDKFRGMYAFAIYDAVERSIFIARDCIGIKPLYYHQRESSFVFASDMTTLIASGLYDPKPNWNGLCLGIAFQGSPRPSTSYKDAFALSPGHYLSGRAVGSKQIVQYWDLPVGQQLDISEEKALERYEELLHQAIKRCLIADVEVGTLMSGGLDSTTMTAIAASMHPTIRAFTLAYDTALDSLSELDQAHATAKMHNLSHTITRFRKEDLMGSLDDMLWVFEEPIGALEPHYPIAQNISKHGIRVILNGLGPDELMGGYGYYRNLQQHWPWLKHLSFLAPFIPRKGRLTTAARIMESSDPFDIFRRLFASYLYENPASVFADNLLDDNIDALAAIRSASPDLKKFTDSFQALSYADMKFYIGTHHNHTSDRFLMRFHIEGRFPYLDRDLVEFCFRLPTHLKWRKDQSKYLLRKLSAKYIHPSCLEMKKKGFGIPEADFITGSIEQVLRKRVEQLKERAVFKRSALEDVLNDRSGTTRAARRLLYFANFELWYHWFIDRQHPKLLPVGPGSTTLLQPKLAKAY